VLKPRDLSYLIYFLVTLPLGQRGSPIAYKQPLKKSTAKQQTIPLLRNVGVYSMALCTLCSLYLYVCIPLNSTRIGSLAKKWLLIMSHWFFVWFFVGESVWRDTIRRQLRTRHLWHAERGQRHESRYTVQTNLRRTWGRCYDHIFLRKKCRFKKTKAMILFL
jgi:hypothetical protein